MPASSPPTTPPFARNSLITDSLKPFGSDRQSLIRLGKAIGERQAPAHGRFGRDELQAMGLRALR